MAKDGEMIVYEAAEIMRSLPSEMQRDDEIMDSVIVSLQTGVSKLAARQDALEIAQLKMQEAMAHGFNLVNGEIQSIKHSAELDRVHAQYAKQEAQQARSVADQALLRIHEVATMAAVASAKADGATEVAKVSSKSHGLDPLAGMAIASIVLIVAFTFMSIKVERAPEKQPSLGEALKEFCNDPKNSCTDGRRRPVIPASNL